MLGLWERTSTFTNSALLLAIAVWSLLTRTIDAPVATAAPRRPGQAEVRDRWRVASLSALGLMVVPLAVSILVQPSWDLRRDLVSDLAAKGAVLPALGQAAILSIAVAHGCAAVALALRRMRPAAGAAGIAAVCLIGVALVQITCPRGASGCSGPESGRVLPRATTDVVHRDLVVVLELASLVLAVAIVLHLRATGRARLAGTTGTVAVLSALLLLAQQGGQDIGWWQLSWLLMTSAIVVLALVAAARTSEPEPSSSMLAVPPAIEESDDDRPRATWAGPTDAGDPAADGRAFPRGRRGPRA